MSRGVVFQRQHRQHIEKRHRHRRQQRRRGDVPVTVDVSRYRNAENDVIAPEDPLGQHSPLAGGLYKKPHHEEGRRRHKQDANDGKEHQLRLERRL